MPILLDAVYGGTTAKRAGDNGSNGPLLTNFENYCADTELHDAGRAAVERLDGGRRGVLSREARRPARYRQRPDGPSARRVSAGPPEILPRPLEAGSG